MHLPGPLRAAVGLAATAATEAKHLPDRAIELPMLMVSSALQASLRAQQRYARFAARGDEVLNRRTPTEEPPPWATFDAPVPVEEILAPDEPSVDAVVEAVTAAPTSIATTTATRTAPTPRAPARKAPARKAPTRKAPTRKAPTRKAPTRTEPSGAKPAGFADPAVGRAKTVSKPRHTAPSAFDDVPEDGTEGGTGDRTGD